MKIFYVLHDSITVNNSGMDIISINIVRKYNLSERTSKLIDHDYSFISNISSITEYKKIAISYVSGFIFRMVKKQIFCMLCCNAIGSKKHAPESNFLKVKDSGDHIKPTKDLIVVCKETEKKVTRMLATIPEKLLA